MTKAKAVHYGAFDKTPCGKAFFTVTMTTDRSAVTCQSCLKLLPIVRVEQVSTPDEPTIRAAWTPEAHVRQTVARTIAYRAARFRREGDAFMNYYRQERNPADHERAMRHYALAFNTEFTHRLVI